MYNDSGAAEKAWDNLYDRNEDAEVRYCPDCEGTGIEQEVYSCCGDIVESEDNDNCKTCGEHCGYEHERCETCKGEGVL